MTGSLIGISFVLMAAKSFVKYLVTEKKSYTKKFIIIILVEHGIM